MLPEPIVRKYKVADAYMLEYAKTQRNSFISDQPLFINEDSNYANPFEDDWKSAIIAAESHPTDEQRKDQLEQLTETVLVEMTLCRDTFQRAKRYIEKAFPNDSGIWNEFGFNDYADVDRSQPLMIQFMKRFHTTAVKYEAKLIVPTVNFGLSRIAEIETRRAALDAANDAQEKFKKDLPVFTQKRIVAHNAVWDICSDVASVGKYLFRNDAARYQHYLLPPSEESEGTLLLSGTVTSMPDANSSTGTPIEGALTELLPMGLQSETDSNGMFGYGNANAGPATLKVSHPLYLEQNIPVTIDPSNPKVVNVDLKPITPPVP